jgi:hypothetical protein
MGVGNQSSANLLHKRAEFQLVHSKATFIVAESLLSGPRVFEYIPYADY